YVNDHPTAGDDGWVVARWRGFEIVARDAEDPRKDARSLASRLGGASRRALAVAVGTDELALAAPRLGVGGSTRVIAVSLAHPDQPSLRFLESLRPNRAPNALAQALRVADLLSTEAVSE